MKLSIIIESADLLRAWDFFSILGMTWLDGSEDRAGAWLTAERDYLDEHGLPRLIGEMGGVEFLFYRVASSPSWSPPSGTCMLIHYDRPGHAGGVVEQLKGKNLFAPCPSFDIDLRVDVMDPDGRRFSLCDPNPFSA